MNLKILLSFTLLFIASLLSVGCQKEEIIGGENNLKIESEIEQEEYIDSVELLQNDNKKRYIEWDIFDDNCDLKKFKVVKWDQKIFLWIAKSWCDIDNKWNWQVFLTTDKLDYWIHRLTIEDMNLFHKNRNNEFSNNNHPIAFTIESGWLILTVLDGNWWGSGDWIESVLRFYKKWWWKTIRCYNYNNWWNFEELDYDGKITDWWYSKWTTMFNYLNQIPISECQENVRISYFNEKKIGEILNNLP